MDLDVFWHPPVSLHDGRKEGLILACDLEQVPEAAGVYAFCRVFGENIEPIYIGRAADVRRRVQWHLESNVRLVHKIVGAKSGEKVVLPGVWKPKPGQSAGKALPIIEAALIKFAIAEGHDLLNKQGVKMRVHTIKSSGNRAASSYLFRRTINIEK